ncbi:ribokinase [Niallia nealsonii]|uniref:Ribokinase n=1 Tax=Niallia nealsonii TaxID=115979 RepID=A0A2N0Z1S4_9BACI|nr:ribokinase [Niallia nealsonii]PKG23464.1 ribokinase [Niallia nealsonii]
MKKMLVVGSINMDIVNKVEKHPLPGETVAGSGVSYIPGGKGANQAVAAAKAGGAVTMIGAVGSDVFAKELKESLKKYGVNTDYVITKNISSGLAFITLDSQGENTIILSGGANTELTKEDLAPYLNRLENYESLLLQNELHTNTNEWLIKEAEKRGVSIFWNPAPAYKVPKELLAKIDTLIVNETETEIITGLRIQDKETAEKAAKLLIEDGVRNVLITLGTNGSYFYGTNGETVYTDAYHVDAIDTTAAGDTFIGAYAQATMMNMSAKEALQFASAAAAISVTRFGAQQSSPTKEEIEAFLIKEKK